MFVGRTTLLPRGNFTFPPVPVSVLEGKNLILFPGLESLEKRIPRFTVVFLGGELFIGILGDIRNGLFVDTFMADWLFKYCCNLLLLLLFPRNRFAEG
jgi:hypothetical protein